MHEILIARKIIKKLILSLNIDVDIDNQGI
jgi:hypothetical protein